MTKEPKQPLDTFLVRIGDTFCQVDCMSEPVWSEMLETTHVAVNLSSRLNDDLWVFEGAFLMNYVIYVLLEASRLDGGGADINVLSAEDRRVIHQWSLDRGD